MSKQKQKSASKDNVFALKLVLYVVLGSLWLKVFKNDHLAVPLPIGLLVGMFYARHDHFQIDRKIEYAVLIVAALVGFWVPFGLYLSLT
jgi:hypothetical protein